MLSGKRALSLSLCLVLTLAVASTTAGQAAEIRGRVQLSLRKDHTTVFIEGQSATVFDEIFILTNKSNAKATILGIRAPELRQLDKDADDIVVKNSVMVADTEPCKGMTLAPGDVCAFSVTFDTADNSGVNDADLSRWQIAVSANISYQTRPFPQIEPTNTVFDRLYLISESTSS
jgi:hypothetical protein